MHISKKSQDGFTIIEIMIVITIIGMLMAVLIPAYRSQQKRATQGATKVQMKQIASALEQYNEDMGDYPQTLKDLVKEPSDEKAREQWRGPYFETKNNEAPKDPFNKPYRYAPTPNADHPYELISYGSSSGKGSAKKDWIDVWKI